MHEAIKLYSKGISVSPSAALFANRAAAWLAVGAPAEAASDCRAALAIDPTYAKASARLGKCLVELGDAEGAVAHLRAAAVATQRSSPGFAAIADELGRAEELAALLAGAAASTSAGAHADAASLLEAAAARTSSVRVALAAAAAEVAAAAPDKALRITLRLLRADPACAEAHVLRAAAHLVVRAHCSASYFNFLTRFFLCWDHARRRASSRRAWRTPERRCGCSRTTAPPRSCSAPPSAPPHPPQPRGPPSSSAPSMPRWPPSMRRWRLCAALQPCLPHPPPSPLPPRCSRSRFPPRCA